MNDAMTLARARNHVSLPGAGRTETVLGTELTYKAEASDTGGQLVCVEITVAPGQGIPPHRHRDEDEAFYVLAGSIVIEGDGCADGGTPLEPGSFFYGPRGLVHGFRATGADTAKLLVLVTPGTGIAAMFGELAVLTRQLHQDGFDPARVAELCGRYGVDFSRA